MDMTTLLSEEALAEAQALKQRPLTDFLDNRGRVAVVTGAARGLGLAIARRLAESGAAVLMADRLEDELAIALDALPTELRQRVEAAVLDVTDSAAIADLAERASARTGRIDIWVNNAGVFPPTGPIAEAEDEVLDRILAVNVRGAFAGAREAARRMGRGGVILNIASIGGIRGQGGMAGYSASKHAVVGMTRSLAIELGKAGIRVLAIAPGMTVSPGNSEMLEKVMASGHKLAALNAPLGRIGLADDIARVALFATSDMAAMMTGQVLVVDGGATA